MQIMAMAAVSVFVELVAVTELVLDEIDNFAPVVNVPAPVHEPVQCGENAQPVANV
jgi:hypothetical protein